MFRALLLLLTVWTGRSATLSLMESLNSRFDVITFANFLRQSKLDSVLNDTKVSYIVLVPKQEAFDILPDKYLRQLHDTKYAHHRTMLTNLLNYHIIPYNGSSLHAWNGDRINTLLGKPIRMVYYPHKKVLVANGVVLHASNMTADNGLIFMVNEVLSPPNKGIYDSLLHDPRYSSFLSAITLAGLRYKLQTDNITVLAPTNDAFSLLKQEQTENLYNDHASLQAFLGFHIIPGIFFTKGIYSGMHITNKNMFSFNMAFHIPYHNNIVVSPTESHLVDSDLLATNGVIHTINHVVLPKFCVHHNLIG